MTSKKTQNYDKEEMNEGVSAEDFEEQIKQIKENKNKKSSFQKIVEASTGLVEKGENFEE